MTYPEIMIQRLTDLLSGKTVDGLKIGDPGLDREWIESQIREYSAQIRESRRSDPRYRIQIPA